jgi:hypothetical protein
MRQLVVILLTHPETLIHPVIHERRGTQFFQLTAIGEF